MSNKLPRIVDAVTWKKDLNADSACEKHMILVKVGWSFVLTAIGGGLAALPAEKVLKEGSKAAKKVEEARKAAEAAKEAGEAAAGIAKKSNARKHTFEVAAFAFNTGSAMGLLVSL